MTNIKVSKIFSVLILVIVVGYFLLPNLLSLYSLNKASSFNDEIYERQIKNENRLMNSFHELSIKDEGLSQCIETTLYRFKGVPVENGGLENVSQLSSLFCSGYKIASLEELRQFKNLKSIDLSDNNFSDVSPLIDLYSLERLSLRNNELIDIRVLYDIASLKVLELPDTSGILCANLSDFIANAKFQVQGKDYALSNCRGNTTTVYAKDQMNRLKRKKNIGQELSREEKIKILQNKVNEQQAKYDQKYRAN